MPASGVASAGLATDGLTKALATSDPDRAASRFGLLGRRRALALPGPHLRFDPISEIPVDVAEVVEGTNQHRLASACTFAGRTE